MELTFQQQRISKFHKSNPKLQIYHVLFDDMPKSLVTGMIRVNAFYEEAG